jgi:hypothetical protein
MIHGPGTFSNTKNLKPLYHLNAMMSMTGSLRKFKDRQMIEYGSVTDESAGIRTIVYIYLELSYLGVVI